MKRSLLLALVIGLVAATAIGCNTTPAPSPTVTPGIDAGVSPGIDAGVSPGIDAGVTPDAALSPDLNTSPGALTSPGLDTTPGSGGGTEATIPNFKEGTEVDEADVPEIKAALQEQYEGAKISRITHVTHSGMQVYSVEYTGQDGKVKTVYIKPGGGFIAEDGSLGGSGASNTPAKNPNEAGGTAGGTGTP